MVVSRATILGIKKDIEKLEFFTHDPISLNALIIDLFLKRKRRHHDVNFENLLHD